VRSIDDGGRANKAGNRSFLRFVPTQSGIVTLTLATSNVATDRDPDFLVWTASNLLTRIPVADGREGSAEYPETETFAVTAGQTYLIEAYDCANGCDDESGTPGDYNLTATIN
jgi:hypothetical protein